MGSGQMSFFSAGARPAEPNDLEGLLCGPGQVVRRAGAARVSVVVYDLWRVEPLLAALDTVGLGGEAVDAHEDDGVAVRTPFDARLLPLAARWSGKGAKRAPPGLDIDGPRLRWWALAAGWRDPYGYMLGLGPQDESTWAPVGAALAHAGLPAALLGPRADGPAYRISGSRRLVRLAELVGERPPGLPERGWPGG